MSESSSWTYPTSRAVEPAARPPKFHQEEAVVGETLNNYITKEPSDDGTYVKIITHSERIEKIRQPLTPEEIAEKKKQDKIAAGIIGTVAIAFFGFIGWVTYQDEKQHRNRPRPVQERKDES